MTRVEYLKRLEEALEKSGWAKEHIQSTVNYYSDYFDEASDDEKLLNELGTPENLAKQLCEKEIVKKQDDKKSEETKEKNTSESSGLYFEFSKDSVRNVSFDFGATEVVAISGDFFGIETRGINKRNLNVHLSSEGTLNVNNRGNGVNIRLFSHDRRRRIIPRVLLTIPRGVKLNWLRINIGAGNFVAKDLEISCNDFEISVGAGNLVLNKILGGKAKIECGMGNLDFTGKITKIADVDCGMGVVKMNILGKKEDFSYDAEVGLGDLQFNDEKKYGICKIFDNEKKLNHISVNCGMGCVNVQIKDCI